MCFNFCFISTAIFNYYHSADDLKICVSPANLANYRPSISKQITSFFVEIQNRQSIFRLSFSVLSRKQVRLFDYCRSISWKSYTCEMDVQTFLFGGMQADPIIISTLSTLLTALLYIKYWIDSYAVTNIPTKSLLPSYDFIIVGSGSAGMFLIFCLLYVNRFSKEEIFERSKVR